MDGLIFVFYSQKLNFDREPILTYRVRERHAGRLEDSGMRAEFSDWKRKERQFRVWSNLN